jgi:hypothetical protein
MGRRLKPEDKISLKSFVIFASKEKVEMSFINTSMEVVG